MTDVNLSGTQQRTSGAAAAAPPTRSRRLPWRKRILFSIVLGLLTYGVLEFLSWMGLMWNFGNVSHVQQALHKQAETKIVIGVGFNQAKEDQAAFPYEVLHPYLGFVHRPETVTAGRTPVEFGLATSTPIHRKTPGQVLVAVVGGSVAEFFVAEAGEHFCRLLEKQPAFAGKKVVLISLGLSSYKQPQQLLLINYLMTLGAEFDYIINLDGYNELVLASVFNAPHNVYPSFPREWNLRVTRAADVETLRLVGRIAYPLLQAAGQRLRSNNVNWHDLTQIYAKIEAMIYRDTCCHVNGEGNRMLAEAMAGFIESPNASRTPR